MASKTEKIAALEERMAELETLLADPLALFARALKSASAEEAKEWVLAAHEKIMAHKELWSSGEDAEAPAKAPKGKKAPKEKKAATTNKEGPTVWNTFVSSVQRELAEAAGVDRDSFFEDVDEDDAAAVEKAEAKFKEAAKKAGADWQVALKEASIQKKMTEKGLSREDAEAEAAAEREKKGAAKAKKAASVASSEASSVRSAPSVASAPKPAKKAPKAKKPAVDETAVEMVKEAGASDEDLAELATLNIFPRLLEDMVYYMDLSSKEVYQVEEGGILGERIGVYNEKTGELK
jgi:hypothetical protein